jgi:hypothetical protein
MISWSTGAKDLDQRRLSWRPPFAGVPPGNHLPEKKSRSGLQSACDELIDKGAIITGE